MKRLLDVLCGENASEATRESFRQRVVDNHMNDTEIEIEVEDTPPPHCTDGHPWNVWSGRNDQSV